MKHRRNSLLLSCLIWACIFLMDSISTHAAAQTEVASFTPDPAPAIVSTDYTQPMGAEDFTSLLTFES